ncbi:hypothetical protein N9J07_04595 [Bacteroidia bacterium]|nr:hypothetical protein [Bacteroidia bacterium]
MRNVLVIIALTFSAVTLVAQDSLVVNQRLSFGVSPFATIATATGINDDRPPYGVGGDMFASYCLNKNYLYGKLGYKRYWVNTLASQTTVEDIHLLAAFKKPLSQAKGVNLVLGYVPTFVINASRRYRGNSDSIPTVFFQDQLENRFSHGFYAGLEFQSKDNGSIDFGYTYIANKTETNGFYDAIPSHFTIAYNFNFNTNAEVPEDVYQARMSLKRLQNDTLYFINRGCESDYTFEQLDSLLATNYTYSAYRLLHDSEIDVVSKQPNVVHFAVIGKHYGGLADPESNGVYLLDSKLNSTEFPYPYHSSNPKNSNGFSDCFGGIANTKALIRKFNWRLDKKYNQLREY